MPQPGLKHNGRVFFEENLTQFSIAVKHTWHHLFFWRSNRPNQKCQDPEGKCSLVTDFGEAWVCIRDSAHDWSPMCSLLRLLG